MLHAVWLWIYCVVIVFIYNTWAQQHKSTCITENWIVEISVLRGPIIIFTVNCFSVGQLFFANVRNLRNLRMRMESVLSPMHTTVILLPCFFFFGFLFLLARSVGQKKWSRKLSPTRSAPIFVTQSWCVYIYSRIVFTDANRLFARIKWRIKRRHLWWRHRIRECEYIHECE